MFSGMTISYAFCGAARRCVCLGGCRVQKEFSKHNFAKAWTMAVGDELTASFRRPLMAASPVSNSSSLSSSAFSAGTSLTSPSLAMPDFRCANFSCTISAASASLRLLKSLPALSVAVVEPCCEFDERTRGSTMSQAAAPFLRSRYA